jgi:hypothetical protein
MSARRPLAVVDRAFNGARYYAAPAESTTQGVVSNNNRDDRSRFDNGPRFGEFEKWDIQLTRRCNFALTRIGPQRFLPLWQHRQLCR